MTNESPLKWIAALVESEIEDTLTAQSAGAPDLHVRRRAEAVAEYVVNRLLSEKPDAT